MNRCKRATFDKTQNRVLWKIEVAVRACRRKQSIKREVARYIGAVKGENLVWANGKLGVNLWLAYMQKIEIFAFSSQTFRFPKQQFSVLSKTTSRQTLPFHDTHNLLSAQIGACLFKNTDKSLRSKACVSHRFKILRAVWHKTTIFAKIS